MWFSSLSVMVRNVHSFHFSLSPSWQDAWSLFLWDLPTLLCYTISFGCVSAYRTLCSRSFTPLQKISTNNCPWANNLKSSRALQWLTPDMRSSFPWLEDGGKTQRHTAAVSLATRHVAGLCRVPCCPCSWVVRFLCIWCYKRERWEEALGVTRGLIAHEMEH